MRLILNGLLLVALCAMPALGALAGNADGVQARLAKPAVLRGEFVQEKQLKGFRNPLKSSGDFLLLRERGVLWNTRAPFASTTSLTRGKLLTRLPDGSTQTVIETKDAPAMQSVAALMMALMAGDVGALRARFDLTESVHQDGSWTLAMTPRDATLKRAISRIDLQGARHVQAVEIVEAGGDRTRIRFNALKEAPPPTAREAAQLD